MNQFSLKECIIIGIIMALIFGGLTVWWYQHPALTEGITHQQENRQRAIDYVRTHQYDVPGEELQAIMKAYNLTNAELYPPAPKGQVDFYKGQRGNQ